MSQHFNKLSNAEVERLSMLAEEAGEIVQAVGKVLRHGYHSHHPDGSPNNRVMLAKEVTDIQAVIQAMEIAGDIAPSTSLRGTWIKKQKYTHHQSPTNDQG